MKTTRKALGALAVGLMGAGVLGACAPAAPAPAPAPDPGPDAVTTTTSVEFACIGTGLSSSAVIANQTTTVAITVPADGATAGAFNAIVDYGNLNLSAAPEFLILNNSGVVATASTTGLSANPSVAADNFVGNGASIDVKPMAGAGTAVAGSNTVTAGQVTLKVGETGFLCTPVGAGASATFTAV